MQIKPLEWTYEPDAPDGRRADTIGGTYFIIDDTDDFTGYYLEFVTHNNAEWWGNVKVAREHLADQHYDDDLAPLEAIADAHNVARIMTALATEAQP
ncbi:hypothetical protein [Loktanella sp. R86503]|uniref:hypothetical protein n=1 Tax=Loktanella sp. R86503 TaxID=3093847 RepID=UPI0036D82092